MNQGLLIVVLLLLVLLLSCKAFNYCVLRELFQNKEIVRQMMDDIYGVREHFDHGVEVDDCETESQGRTSAWLIKHGCPVENYKNIDNFEGDMSDCQRRYIESKSESEKAAIIADGCPEVAVPTTEPAATPVTEGFRCCENEDELIEGGCQMCDGFVNYSPFKETFADVTTLAPTLSAKAFEPITPRKVA